MPLQLTLGLVLSALIGYVGYRRQSLSASGLLGAVLVGTTIFGLGGWAWGTLLVVFFVSSSALSHFKAARKLALAEKFSKGSQRDLAQALANGGAAALLAVAFGLWPNPDWWSWPHPVLWAAFVAAVATVNADTWATELGVLSRTPPRLITTGQPVAVGTSGGLTGLGTLAALAGAALIGAIGGLAYGRWRISACEFCDNSFVFLHSFGVLFAASTVAGFLGSLADSLLGATVQAIYVCDRCGQPTERHPTHRCGGLTHRIRGWPWLDNDLVNFISSVAGAGGAIVLWWLLS